MSRIVQGAQCAPSPCATELGVRRRQYFAESVLLTHYTDSAKTVAAILRHGLAWVPNRRHLIHDFLPNHDFSAREPQEFGMISFTDLAPADATRHRAHFGGYGIVVSDDWAKRHQAQRVLYIEREGPVFDTFRYLFRTAYDELKKGIRYPDDSFWTMAYTNRAATGFAGGNLYGNLLTLYEYMELAENSFQQEWRIVNPMPLYGLSQITSEVIANVSPPRGWGKEVHVVKLRPEDVVRVICPTGESNVVRSLLPSGWENLHVVEHGSTGEADVLA